MNSCRPRGGKKTHRGDIELGCPWQWLRLTQACLYVPPLSSTSLSSQRTPLWGLHTVSVAACIFKLMNGCDNCCCIFKHTRKVRPTTLRLRLDFNILKSTHGNGDFIWWLPVKVESGGANASAEELERTPPEGGEGPQGGNVRPSDSLVGANPPTSRVPRLV